MSNDHTLGDQPIQPELVRIMNTIAHHLDEAFNGEARGKDRKTGFILMVFPFNETAPGGQGRCNYISNADRADVVTMLKEQVKRFEGQPEVTGRA